MKNIIIITAIILLFQVCSAQTMQPMSANYYEVEGTIIYDIKGCSPGSNIAFYSEKYGGKQLREVTVNNKGELLFDAEKKFKPAFVLNMKDKNNDGIKGSGRVIHFENREFVFNDLKITNSVNGAVLSWNAAFYNTDGYIFEILKSVDGKFYEKTEKIHASSNSVSPYTYNDRGAVNAKYKIRIFNQSKGIDYTSRALSIISDNIRVYPTTVSDNINVVICSQYVGQGYSIINSQGQVVQSGKIEAEHSSLKVSEFSSGLYFISVSDNKLTAKFIKL